MLNQLQAQQPQTIDEMVQKHLELMLPNLYQQLSTHLSEQVNQKTETHNQQITQYLDELDKLQKSEIATLKKGREEFQKLQEKIQQALSKLQSIQPDGDSDIEKSINSLQASVKTLQDSLKQQSSEQQDLENLIDELTCLKQDMTTTLSNLKQHQTTLAQSLAQFQPLLKP